MIPVNLFLIRFPSIVLALVLALIMAFTNSCQWGEDDGREIQPIDALPPATQTGQATFGCLVNGAPMVAREKWNHHIDNTFLRYGTLLNDTTSRLVIEASTEVKRATIVKDNFSYRSIRLQINDVADTNIRTLRLVPLNQNSANTFTAELLVNELNGTSVNGTSLNDTWSKVGDSGTVEITQFRRPNPNIRGDRGAVSGRFSFVINHPTAGSFNVTEGRFDFPLISR